MKNPFDLIVIGAGSGGIATANMAAKNGAKVLVIENNQMGGTCVNRGCVPKKLMWLASDRLLSIKHAGAFTIKTKGYEFDFKAFVEKRENEIKRLQHLYVETLEKNKITVLQGEASFIDCHTLSVGNKTVTGEKIVIATGSYPRLPDIPGKDLGISSDGFFALQSVPKKVAVVGAGYIAAELASMLSAFGAETHFFFRHDTILREFDSFLGKTLLTYYEKSGIFLHPNKTPKSIEKTSDNKKTITFEDETSHTGFDEILWAIGRMPQTKALHLSKIGLKTTKGYIDVDDVQKTNIDNIFAIGDVTGKKLLTPVAIKEGRNLARRLFTNDHVAPINYSTIPTVIFSHPPIATCGPTTEEVEKAFNGDITVYNSTFTPMSQTFYNEKEKSVMKLVVSNCDNRVRAIHMIGDGVDEMLQGFAVAIELGATKEDFDKTVAIHPTSSEELVTMK